MLLVYDYLSKTWLIQYKPTPWFYIEADWLHTGIRVHWHSIHCHTSSGFHYWLEHRSANLQNGHNDIVTIIVNSNSVVDVGVVVFTDGLVVSHPANDWLWATVSRTCCRYTRTIGNKDRISWSRKKRCRLIDWEWIYIIIIVLLVSIIMQKVMRWCDITF